MSPLPFVPDADPLSAPTRVTPSNGSAASPQTTTLTLPQGGMYLVSVVCKLQGSRDHMMTGLWLVQFYDATSNDTLVATQIGTTSKSASSAFSLTALTLSNPTSGGVLTATATWGNGLSYSASWDVRARQLSTF